jgi:hypothetical protein
LRPIAHHIHRKTALWILDRNRFDADLHPDPTFHFDADTDPDPHPDPTPSFTYVINRIFLFTLVHFTVMPVYIVLSFSLVP